MPAEPLIPMDRWNLEKVLFGPEEIRKTNAQRFEMEHLDAVTLLDTAAQEIVGYKDVRADEFWVPGHIPGRPIFPGVLMIEAAAQVARFGTLMRLKDRFMGFAGVDEVKFRGQVVPGDRLILLGFETDFRPRRVVCQGQGWVNGNLVFEAKITGMPM